MVVDHIGIICKDMNKMKEFYENIFDVKSSSMYENKANNFKSYFLYFEDKSAIELMNNKDENNDLDNNYIGLHHFAIGVDSKNQVDEIAKKIKNYQKECIIREPRTSGLGDYLVTIKDIENNLIEVIFSNRIKEDD